MQVNISSDILKVKVDSFGAELHSVKDYNDTEYLWQADERIWKRHAPVLFPFVCNTASKKYTVNGKEFALSNHGFARDSEFELLFAKENSTEFYLGFTDETLKIYPFRFGLYVNYTIDGNKLKVTYTVENKDDKDIYFFIGGHPAFRCPVCNSKSFSDCFNLSSLYCLPFISDNSSNFFLSSLMFFLSRSLEAKSVFTDASFSDMLSFAPSFSGCLSSVAFLEALPDFFSSPFFLYLKLFLCCSSHCCLLRR